ncbi:ASCH domain-containing protein [Candidatus Woesearchaeota archaeon]|jgi:ASC-1-like (ASCH) protein|nr:ASCH domain-containing protein [Candidatus Woesearchaeota archaeon]
MQHSMRLDKNPFRKIKSGKKIIEVRLYDKKRQRLNVGDIIKFAERPDFKHKQKVKITSLFIYPTFVELVNCFDINLFGYSQNYSKEKFVESFFKIYSKEQESEYGVVGIKIELI